MKQYKVGMYAGAFNPLHNGHVHCIQEALDVCEEVYVVLCATTHDEIQAGIRKEWIEEEFKENPHVHVVIQEEDIIDKSLYDWSKAGLEVKEKIGVPISVLFMGLEYKGKPTVFKQIFKESQLYFFDRTIIPISSTMIREDYETYKAYLPLSVLNYFENKRK